MYTSNTFEILGECADSIQDSVIPGIEHVHLRGAMFGYYKKGTNPTKVDGRWPDKGLQLMKPGKFIKMIHPSMSDEMTERIVNRLKAYVANKGDEYGEGIEAPMFSVANGQLISHYYLEENYVEKRGNLGGSCMRYASCQPYFKIYESNDDVVSMLVLRNSDHVIVARALLWYDGTDTYMDTIYHIADKYVESMIDYACKHGIYYKKQQSCHYFAFDMLNRNKVEAKILKIPITKIDFSKWEFPWLDTLMYGVNTGEEFYLTNCLTSDINTGEGRLYQFRSTSGSYDNFTIDKDDRLLHMETAFALLYGSKRSPSVTKFLEARGNLSEAAAEDRDGMVSNWNHSVLYQIIKDHDYSCRSYTKLFINDEPDKGQVEINGEFYNEEDCVLDVDDNWVHCDDAVEVNGYWYHVDDDRVVYVDRRGQYYHRDDVTYLVSRSEYYLNDDTTYCEYNQESIHCDDAVYVENYGHVHEDDVDEVAVEIDGSYYRTEDCFQCEITDEWYLKSDKCELPDGRVVCQEEYDNWMEENDTDEEEVEEQP